MPNGIEASKSKDGVLEIQAPLPAESKSQPLSIHVKGQRPVGGIANPSHDAAKGVSKMTTQNLEQRVDGIGHEPAHSHRATVHTHDHYHVSHHHRNWVEGAFGEWEHRTYWHTHEHNHSLLIHSHDYEHADEDAHHASEAHSHDHANPRHSPA